MGWYMLPVHPFTVSTTPSAIGPFDTHAEAIAEYHRVRSQAEPLLTVKMVKQAARRRPR
jgi:hypothetical protein